MGSCKSDQKRIQFRNKNHLKLALSKQNYPDFQNLPQSSKGRHRNWTSGRLKGGMICGKEKEEESSKESKEEKKKITTAQNWLMGDCIYWPQIWMSLSWDISSQ